MNLLIQVGKPCKVGSKLNNMSLTRYSVLVKPSSRTRIVQEMDDGSLQVRLKSSAQDGKANKELITFLADYFHTSPSSIIIEAGLKARKKRIAVFYD